MYLFTGLHLLPVNCVALVTIEHLEQNFAERMQLNIPENHGLLHGSTQSIPESHSDLLQAILPSSH